MPQYLARYSYIGATYECMTLLPDSSRTTEEHRFCADNDDAARKKALENLPNVAEGKFKDGPVRLDSLMPIGSELIKQRV